MTTPDTTEAVMRAIAEPLAESYGRLQDFEYKAKLAIAADRKALAEQGYVIVKTKRVPLSEIVERYPLSYPVEVVTE